jgi:hypothetical protein
MIASGQQTSLLIPSQLPGFIRDNPDYQNFVLFLQAYYEWMELSNTSNSSITTATTGQGITYATKNLLNYGDIDSTTSQFIDYFVNDFLQYFPQDALISKDKAIKVARQLYQTKGTPASYQFLFRTLYNSDFSLFNTGDAVLKASGGNWYIPRSLRIIYNNPSAGETQNYFLNKKNFLIFGPTSKAYATIENSILRPDGTVEVFISNLGRIFKTGETVYVTDSNFTLIKDDFGQNISGTLVGQINQINIDSKNRGLFYQPGDPVVVYGGLSSAQAGGAATATVGSVTTGSIIGINVLNGGYGYQQDPNTVINISATGASAKVTFIDPTSSKVANVALIPSDVITLSQTTTIGNSVYSFFSNNMNANANTTLANAFNFLSLSTYPILSVLLTNPVSGLSGTPTITATSIINTATGTADLASLGILAPLQIINGGSGYAVGDTINIIDGGGVGAYANVTNVSVSGAITSASYVYRSNQNYPLGGLGYIATPTTTVTSVNSGANGAVIIPGGILGTGASFAATTDRAGAVSTILITNPGTNYSNTPNVSLKVADILVSNVSLTQFPQQGDIVYQGPSLNNSTFRASVDSIYYNVGYENSDPTKSIYQLRLYNYTSAPNPSLKLINNTSGDNYVLANTNIVNPTFYNPQGVHYYGDGTALATASFLNGLVIGQGQYLDGQGWPSGFNVLQSDTYNSFTYEITVQKEIAKYREVLLKLLHPTGMQIIGRVTSEANANFLRSSSDAFLGALTLQDYTGYPPSEIAMVTDFVNKSNNILQFSNLAGANLAGFITTGTSNGTNSFIKVTSSVGVNIFSEVIRLDPIGNTVTLKDNTWLTFANVAYVTANSGSNVINISSLTGSYDIVNNGNYSNPNYPLLDVVYAGDTISIANNPPLTVASVNYLSNSITTTTNVTSPANSLMAVNRTFKNIRSVIIYGPLGIQYTEELITEDGKNLTTENDFILLLG